MTAPTRRLPALLAVCVLALASTTACSGGDAGEHAAAPATSASAPATSASAPTTPADTPTTPASTPATPGTAADGDSPAGAPGSGTRYCTLLDTDFAGLFARIQGPKDARHAVGLIRRVARAAPPQVHDDWKLLSRSFGKIQVALAKAARLQKLAEQKKLSADQLQRRTTRLLQQTQALNSPQTQAAGKAVARHAADYCGLQLGG